MNDVRTAVAGVVTCVALIAATYLYATGTTDGAERLAAIAVTFGAYLLGLHSEPMDGTDA